MFPGPLWFGEMWIFSLFFVAVVTLASGCCSEMVKSKALDTLSLINNMPMKVQGLGCLYGCLPKFAHMFVWEHVWMPSWAVSPFGTSVYNSVALHSSLAVQ